MAINPLDVAEGCITSDDPFEPSDTMALLTSTLTPSLPGAAVPYNPDFPQLDGIISSSMNYVLKLPAGITIPSMANPEATNILGFLQPLVDVISKALMILGPIKIIIDIIIAIINVFCSFPDPVKMAAAIIQLILAMISLATLFPIAAALVLLIELLKTIIMILSAILLIIVPKIELIIRNAQTVLELASEDEAAAKGATDKICGLIQDILNDLGILAPINSLLSLISAFAGLAMPELCPKIDSECCKDCPKIVRNPPQGRLQPGALTEDERGFTATLIDATYSRNTTPGIQQLAEVGSVIPFFRELEQTIPFLPLGFISPSSSEPDGSYIVDIIKYIKGFKIAIDKNLGPASISSVSGNKRITATYSVQHGFVEGQEVYFSGSFSGFGRVRSIVSPTSFTADMANPANSTVTLPVDNLTTHGLYKISGMTRGGFENGFNPIITMSIVPGSVPPSGGSVNYKMFVSEDDCGDTLVINCRADVQSALEQFNASLGEVPGNDGNQASPFFSSLRELLGVDIDQLKLNNIDALKEAIQSRIVNPKKPPDDVVALVKSDIDRMSGFLERALCVTVNARNSVFEATAQALDISSDNKIILKFQPRSIGTNGGQAIMAGMPPTINVRGIFTTTKGTLSEVQFDSDTGTYTTELTSDSPGTAEIRAYFVTSDVCSSPAQDAPSLGFPPKVLEVKFIEGNLRPRRQGRQYLPSAGGRRR